MPTIRIGPYRFRFYSSDGSEPPHMHILRENLEAKIWLESLEIEHNHGYSEAELNRILKLTRENRNSLLEAWHEYFGQ
jgi:hypothetical protein